MNQRILSAAIRGSSSARGRYSGVPASTKWLKASSSSCVPSRLFSSKPDEQSSGHAKLGASRATRIDGKEIAKGIRKNLCSDIAQTHRENATFSPRLVIFQVGENPDSSVYVRMKLNAAKEANILAEHRTFPEDVTEQHLLEALQQTSDDAAVNGIIVQLPLPKHISEENTTSAVSEAKDVDGFTVKNIGELAKRRGKPTFMPCTPLAVMELLATTGIDVTGKHAVVLGRSDIVGNPVSYMLRNADATVTLCHSKTKNIHKHVNMADIVVAAIGKPHFVKGDWLKQGAIVIDVGMNSIPDSTKKTGFRYVGDVDYDSAKEFASFITPVPGGVGPMTVAMLLRNVFDSASQHLNEKDS